MTYEEAEYFIFSQLPFFQRDGARAFKAGLKNITALCTLLGNPQNEFKSVHVAGTNGKGSTSHCLASIFQEAGYKTGLYTSPHLKDYRERFKINGQLIPKSVVRDFVSTYKAGIIEINPTFFELTVALSFYWFAKSEVDIAIVEVGLGGRLDATNVITPVLSVITSISYDHQSILGNSLAEIAAEKAGIIKAGVPVVIGEERDETIPVFQEIARVNEAALFHSSQVIVSDIKFEDNLTVTSEFNGLALHISSPLAGFYQVENLKTVIKSCEVLSNLFEITAINVRDGIAKVILNTGLKGRWQVLNKVPFTVCDTGHNEGAWVKINQQLASKKFDHYHFILGFSRDKDFTTILKNLPLPNSVYFCGFDSPRSLKYEQFLLEGIDCRGHFEDVNVAIDHVTRIASDSEMIFIGGSTYLIAEINLI